jgi:hypothetical protein
VELLLPDLCSICLRGELSRGKADFTHRQETDNFFHLRTLSWRGNPQIIRRIDQTEVLDWEQINSNISVEPTYIFPFSFLLVVEFIWRRCVSEPRQYPVRKSRTDCSGTNCYPISVDAFPSFNDDNNTSKCTARISDWGLSHVTRKMSTFALLLESFSTQSNHDQQNRRW